jgi:hypothetical protein
VVGVIWLQARCAFLLQDRHPAPVWVQSCGLSGGVTPDSHVCRAYRRYTRYSAATHRDEAGLMSAAAADAAISEGGDQTCLLAL